MTYEQLQAAYFAAKARTDRLRYTRDRSAMRAAVLEEMAAYDVLLAFEPERGEHRREGDE
jgi:hypothetical protein